MFGLKEKDKLQNEILNKNKTLIYKKNLIFIVTNNENTLSLVYTYKLSHKVNIELTIIRTTETTNKCPKYVSIAETK